MGGAAHEPTAPEKAVAVHEDTPPPAPPQELPRDDIATRRFDHEGRTWLARVAGKGAYGTGSYGLALVEAVHFFDPAQPERALREALLPRGSFEGLFDEELIRLLVESTAIVGPDEGQASR